MHLQNAFYAGLFGATGSLFAKFMGFTLTSIPFTYVYKFICLLLMLSFNTLNMRFFVNSLQESNDTLTATVISSGSNYFFSFAFGILIFSESISVLSVTGILFILIGLYFLSDSKKFKQN